MKDIKDYLHLYYGCEVQFVRAGVTLTGKVVILSAEGVSVQCRHGYCDDLSFSECRLLLRPLSDMTSSEKKELVVFERQFSSVNVLPDVPVTRLLNMHSSRKSDEITRWLISKGFDLFGLIDEGLALDKTQLKEKAV